MGDATENDLTIYTQNYESEKYASCVIGAVYRAIIIRPHLSPMLQITMEHPKSSPCKNNVRELSEWIESLFLVRSSREQRCHCYPCWYSWEYWPIAFMNIFSLRIIYFIMFPDAWEGLQQVYISLQRGQIYINFRIFQRSVETRGLKPKCSLCWFSGS